jgi:hypothetical protein
VGPRTGLKDVERRKILPLQGLELRPLGHPARNRNYQCSYVTGEAALVHVRCSRSPPSLCVQPVMYNCAICHVPGHNQIILLPT